MIIDTSALVCVLDQEPEAERFVRAIALAPERMVSAANWVESGIVMQTRRGDEAVRDLEFYLLSSRSKSFPFPQRKPKSQ